MTARPRLTRHQREVFARVERLSRSRHGQAVALTDIGSVGAVGHLADKGYVTLEERRGPRGGSHWYITQVDPSATSDSVTGTIDP